MFSKKPDPLVDVIKGIVDNTARGQEAEKSVNERFGVYSRKGLPHEKRAEYDTALSQAKQGLLSEAKWKAGREYEIEKEAEAQDRKDRGEPEPKKIKGKVMSGKEFMAQWKKKKK